MPEKQVEQHELRPGGALLLVLIHFGAFLTITMLGAEMTEGRGLPIFLGAGTVVGPLVALYVGLNRYTPQVPTVVALSLGRPRERQWTLIGLALIVGAALGPIVNEITVRILLAWPLEDIGMTLDARTRAMLDVTTVLAAPVTNELLFRGFLLGRMRLSVGPWRAFLVTTAVYVAVILDPRGMPEAIVIAVPAGLFLLWAHSVWAPIVLHVAIEAVRRYGTPEALELQPLGLLVACAGVAAAGLLAAAVLARGGAASRSG